MRVSIVILLAAIVVGAEVLQTDPSADVAALLQKYELQVPGSFLETQANGAPVVLEVDTLTDLLTNVLGRINTARKQIIDRSNQEHEKANKAGLGDKGAQARHMKSVQSELHSAKIDLAKAQGKLAHLHELDDAQQSVVVLAMEKKAQITAEARTRRDSQLQRNTERLAEKEKILKDELELLSRVRGLVQQLKLLRPFVKKDEAATKPVPDDDVDTIAIMYAASKARAKCIAEAKAKNEMAPFKVCEAAFQKQEKSVKSEIFAQAAPVKAAAKVTAEVKAAAAKA